MRDLPPARRHHRQAAALRQAFNAELDTARDARDRGDIAAEWTHLERAHIPDDLTALLEEDPR